MRKPPCGRRFDAETVQEIVGSPATNAALAREHGCSRELIRQIRAGDIYQDLQPKRPRFNASEVREILRSGLTNAEEARRRECGPELIRQIRAGLAYRNLLPYGHLPPDADGPRCERCWHWRADHCGMGFPDPIEEGSFFARDCALYQEVEA